MTRRRMGPRTRPACWTAHGMERRLVPIMVFQMAKTVTIEDCPSNESGVNVKSGKKKDVGITWSGIN
jgi:hypothetical protein